MSVSSFMHGCIIYVFSWYSHKCFTLYQVLLQCSLKYSALYQSPIIAVVFLHRPIFQLNIWSDNGSNFGSFGHSPPLNTCLPFWTCLVSSWLKQPREIASIMLRISMFQPWFAQCNVWCEHFSLTTEHVSFVIRLIMFRPSVNTALVQLQRQGALITILYKAFMRHVTWVKQLVTPVTGGKRVNTSGKLIKTSMKSITRESKYTCI